MEEEKQEFISGIILIILGVIGIFLAGMIFGGAAIGGSIYLIIKAKETKSKLLGIIALVLGIVVFYFAFIGANML